MFASQGCNRCELFIDRLFDRVPYVSLVVGITKPLTGIGPRQQADDRYEIV